MAGKKALLIAQRKATRSLQEKVEEIHEFIRFLADKEGYEFKNEFEDVKTELDAVSAPVQEKAVEVLEDDESTDSGAKNDDSDDSNPGDKTDIVARLSGKSSAIDGNE